MCILGNYWAKNYFHWTEHEICEFGLIGAFFARIFGSDWIRKDEDKTIK